jgi:hypothetical protein
MRFYYLIHEEYAIFIKVSQPGDVHVYRYLRCPLLFVQVNTEKKDILCIYTSNHGH